MAEAVEIIEDDPIEVRRAKREALIAAGIDPYGHSVMRSHTVGELNEKYAHLEDGESTEDAVLIAGRVMAKRVQGKIAFLELRESGCDIQLFCRINALDMNGRERVFTIVGGAESDAHEGKISNESPVGQALLGCKKGDEVTTTGPTGRDIKLTVIKIEH